MKLTKGTIAIVGAAAALYFFPKISRAIEKTQAFISQSITKFKPNGIGFDNNNKLVAKFSSSLQINNKNAIAFPIQDLSVKLFYKIGKDGSYKETGSSIPNFSKYLIPGAKNGNPGILKIEDISFKVNPSSVGGLFDIFGKMSAGAEFMVESKIKVYGIKVSTKSNYKL